MLGRINIYRLVLLLITLGVHAAASVQAQVVLKYSPWIAPKQALNELALKPWADNVSKVTGGRVKVEYLPKAAGSPQAQLEVVQDGIADIVLLVTGYVPGRFELFEMAELPLGGVHSGITSPVLYSLYREHLEPYIDFGNAHVLTLFTGPPSQFITRNVIINNASDFSGLKIRTPTASTANLISALGAVPISKPGTELYELMASGIVDGSLFSFESLFAYNVADILTQTTLFPGGFNTAVFALLVNRSKWEGLSEDDRNAIMKISGTVLASEAGQAQHAGDLQAYERYAKLPGVVVRHATQEVIDDVKSAIRPFEEKWITKAEAMGMKNARAVLAQYRQQLAQTSRAAK